MKTDEVVNTKLKFPLKRVGGMIMGSMAARTGISLEIDFKATFGLTDSQAEDCAVMNLWEFNRYGRLRESGKCHEDAANECWDDPMDGGKDTTGCDI